MIVPILDKFKLIRTRVGQFIIVAQLLFNAKLIDVHLFTALIAASTFSTISVPLLFALLIGHWGEELRAAQGLSENIS